MNTISLLPHRYKVPGWVLLAFSLILWVITLLNGDKSIKILDITFFTAINDSFLQDTTYFGFSEVNFTYTLIGVFFIVGGLLVVFSKEKVEDEYIMQLRLQSLLWAVFVNYVVLLMAFLLIFGLSFTNVLIYNMFTTLVIYILRFNYLLLKSMQ